MSTAATTSPPVIPRWPPNTSNTYITARQSLLEAEWALRDQIEAVAAQRRALPDGAVMKEYIFKESSSSVTSPDYLDASKGTKEVTLAELSKGVKSLIVYSFMWQPSAEHPCPMCALFVDGLNGISQYFEQVGVRLVIVAKAPLEKLLPFAKKRGWNGTRFLSSDKSDFNLDMEVEKPAWIQPSETEQMPLISVFRMAKDGDNEVCRGVNQQAFRTHANTWIARLFVMYIRKPLFSIRT
jgi:predicted dithiol-disulfide oxidoreductase (DUF899 family)